MGALDLNIADQTAGAVTGASPVLVQLRAATGKAHQRLEAKLDAIAYLTDTARRSELIRRYAAFHISADAALAPQLASVEGLNAAGRRRTPLLIDHAPEVLPIFPAPDDALEALGMLYVLEGSTLGGRMILRALADRGIYDLALAFLDPYGPDTGKSWRDFLAVLAREAGRDDARIATVCRGGIIAFEQAEQILCSRAPA